MARVSRRSEDTIKALADGELVLSGECSFFSYIHFCRHAIEACIENGHWEDAERYCDMLEDYSRTRPAPWASFYVSRGRALASFGQRGPDRAVLEELMRLRDSARSTGLAAALPAIEECLEN